MTEVSIETLRRLLRYEPETGLLYWRRRGRQEFRTDRAHNAWNARFADAEIRHREPRGYLRVRFDGKTRSVHRIAWAIHYGEWPDGEIDHINGVPWDNRINNLRAVTGSENSRNRRLWTTNRFGVPGVQPKGSKWQAVIKTLGRTHYLGMFSSFEDAARVRKEAEQKLGFHPNHGRKREEDAANGEPWEIDRNREEVANV